MEAFQPASADETSSVMGASTVTQSFAGRLTNRVYTKWYSLNPAVPDRSGVVETAALGQVITYQSNRY